MTSISHYVDHNYYHLIITWSMHTESVMSAIYYVGKQMISCVLTFPTTCFDLIMKIQAEEMLVCIIIMNQRNEKQTEYSTISQL